MMIFRKIALGSLATVAIGSAAAAQSPEYSWTGVYGGLSVGASAAGRSHGWSPDGACGPAGSVCFAPGKTGFVPYASNSGAPYLLTTDMTPDTSPLGWPGSFGQGGATPAMGLSLEYKRQIGPHLVVGLEDQFSLLARNGGASWALDQSFGPYNAGYLSTATGNRSDRVSVETRARWLNLALGKIGYAQDRSLFYVRGGLAVGDVQASTSAHSTETITRTGDSSGSSTTDTLWSGSNNRLRAGFAIGAGIEQALTDTVSLRLDATYYDLGTAHVTAKGTSLTTGSGTLPVTAGAGTAQSYSVAKKVDGLLVSVGINFRY